jgi:hypothetical protein
MTIEEQFGARPPGGWPVEPVLVLANPLSARTPLLDSRYRSTERVGRLGVRGPRRGAWPAGPDSWVATISLRREGARKRVIG